MKNGTTRKFNRKRLKSTPAPTAPSQRSPGRGVPRWMIAAPCILIMAVVTYFVCDTYVWAKIPGNLIGKWEITEGQQEGAVLEFQRDGTFVGYVNHNEKVATIKSQVNVVGEIIEFVSVHPVTKEQITRTQRIKEQEGDRLVLEDTTTNEIFHLKRTK